MVTTQENINSRFCSVVEIKLIFFLKGGHLPRSGSTLCQAYHIHRDARLIRCGFKELRMQFIEFEIIKLLHRHDDSLKNTLKLACWPFMQATGLKLQLCGLA